MWAVEIERDGWSYQQYHGNCFHNEEFAASSVKIQSSLSERVTQVHLPLSSLGFTPIDSFKIFSKGQCKNITSAPVVS